MNSMIIFSPFISFDIKVTICEGRVEWRVYCRQRKLRLVSVMSLVQSHCCLLLIPG